MGENYGKEGRERRAAAMGKKDRDRGRHGTGANATPGHADERVVQSPFASLGGLRDALPPGRTPDPAPDTTPDTTPGPARPREAVVHLERKGRGGKEVTRLELRPAPPAAGEGGLHDWLGDLKRALGCGGAVEGDAIVVQGDQRERLSAWLASRGVRAR